MVKMKGDLMDGILWAEGLAAQRKEPAQFADYPEHVLQTIRTFQKLWQLPERAIPSKELSGQFQRWVVALNELNQIIGRDINDVLTEAFNKYDAMGKNRFIVSSPAAIKKLVIDVVAERNRRMASEKENEPVHSQQPVDLAEKEELMKMLKVLKKV
jgi:hypothetical protein